MSKAEAIASKLQDSPISQAANLLDYAKELEQQLAEANKKLVEQQAMFHVNMLRAWPEKSHDEIANVIKSKGGADELSALLAKAKEEGIAEAQARIKVLEDALRVYVENSAWPDFSPWLFKHKCETLLSTTSPTEALDKVVREAVEKEQQSRAMFVARLNNIKSHGGTTLSVDEVIAILDDCDMLASNAIRRIEP